MEYRNATDDDIEKVLPLQRSYLVSLMPEADREDGFVTTEFTQAQLSELIATENGLFVALDGGLVVGYAMAASWKFWSSWPLFEYMIGDLPTIRYGDAEVTVGNSYQYGPVCIDKAYRGIGVLNGLFERQKAQMARKYRFLVTFINKANPRSYAAHVGKLGLEVVKTFEFNNNNYYELILDISRLSKA